MSGRVMIVTLTKDDEVERIAATRITQEELEFVNSCMSEDNYVGLRIDTETGNIHWSDGDKDFWILFIDNNEIYSKLENIILSCYGGLNDVEIKDATLDVLHNRIDLTKYGVLEMNCGQMYEIFRIENLDKDIVLDKINLYGVESLTKQDIKILNDQDIDINDFVDDWMEKFKEKDLDDDSE